MENSCLKGGKTEMLVDTGSCVNLIKENLLDPRVWINRRRIHNLMGIAAEMVPTLWEVKIIIKGLETPFQVVTKSFPMLSHASIKLSARIFIGECLATNDKGVAKICIINTLNKDVNLTLPQIELEEYDFLPSSKRTLESQTPKEKQKEQAERFVKVQRILGLQYLNEEEKGSSLPLFFEFSYQFVLPGDKLGVTKVTIHERVTTDEKPVHTKQYRYPHVHKEEIRKQTDELINSGTVRPSFSPYNSPLWIVPKKLDRKEFASGEWLSITVL